MIHPNYILPPSFRPPYRIDIDSADSTRSKHGTIIYAKHDMPIEDYSQNNIEIAVARLHSRIPNLQIVSIYRLRNKRLL